MWKENGGECFEKKGMSKGEGRIISHLACR
jgi:hypothetical protein